MWRSFHYQEKSSRPEWQPAALDNPVMWPPGTIPVTSYDTFQIRSPCYTHKQSIEPCLISSLHLAEKTHLPLTRKTLISDHGTKSNSEHVERVVPWEKPSSILSACPDSSYRTLSKLFLLKGIVTQGRHGSSRLLISPCFGYFLICLLVFTSLKYSSTTQE